MTLAFLARLGLVLKYRHYRRTIRVYPETLRHCHQCSFCVVTFSVSFGDSETMFLPGSKKGKSYFFMCNNIIL